MTIYVISPGRSGSAWLCTLLAGCGMAVAHEWTGTADIPDVVADTSWLWNQDAFFDALPPEDVLIVLDRPAEERRKSVEKLLGFDDEWADLERNWTQFKERIKNTPNTSVWIEYKDLFSRTTKEKLFTTLYYYTGANTGNYEEMWGLLKNMRVTNLTAETEVKSSYGV